MRAMRLRFPATALAVLSLVTLDSLALPIAQAGIERALHASTATMYWALIANCLAWAALLPIGCTLRGRYGDRRVFATGEILLAVASTVAAAAPNGLCLVAGRAGQGAASALIVPTALAHLSDSLSPRLRGALPSFAGGAAELSAVLGSLACAGVVQALGWRWIFWLNVPVCLASTGLGISPGWVGLAPRRSLDPADTLVFAAGSLCIVWALTDVGHQGWASAPILVALVLGTALLGYHTITRMPLGSFRIRELAGFRAAYACGCASLFGAALVLTTRFAPAGGSPLDAWVRLAPLYVGLFACAPLSSTLARRFSPGRLVAVALAACAAGLGLLAAGIGAAAPYPMLLIPFALTGGGIVLALPTARRLTLGVRLLVPGQEPASRGSLRLLAGAVGIGIVSAAAGGRAFVPSHRAGDGTRAEESVAALVAVAVVCAIGAAAAFFATLRHDAAAVVATAYADSTTTARRGRFERPSMRGGGGKGAGPARLAKSAIIPDLAVPRRAVRFRGSPDRPPTLAALPPPQSLGPAPNAL